VAGPSANAASSLAIDERALGARGHGIPWGASGGQCNAWPTPDQELLLGAALLPDGRAVDAWRKLRPRLVDADLDPAAESMLPALRANLVERGVGGELPEEWHELHRLTWARNQMLLAGVLPLVGELERSGIATLLLKGAAFLTDPDLDGGRRPMVDVDVLVPTERAGAAIEVLTGAGLVPLGGEPPWYVADYAPRFVPSHGFWRAGEGQVDLHWHVLHASCQRGADEDFWAAAVPVEVMGVRTRTLCPADELLHSILHGLRWSPLPTYRWVLDAALIARGRRGEVDFGRVVEQARRRLSVAPVRAGLAYLLRVAGAPIPRAALAHLDAHPPSGWERAEFRAQTTQPRHRSRAQRLLIEHQQYARRRVPLGERPSSSRRLALAREELGFERWRDLRPGDVLAGGSPGPGRPASEMAAAIGAGGADPAAPAVAPGTALELDRPDVARRYVAHGVWLPEPGGCWIAGREARLVLPLQRPVTGVLLLSVRADGFLNTRRFRERIEVRANGRHVADFQLDGVRTALLDEGRVLPARAVAGRSTLELVLRTPDAASPAELGLDDDDRRVSVRLRRLVLHEPHPVGIGEGVALGEGSDDERVLAGGWGGPEPFGRWTLGPRAALLLRVETTPGALEPGPLDVELEARAFVGRPGRRVLAEVIANGQRIGSVEYDDPEVGHSATRLPLPAGVIGSNRLLMLRFRIRDPISPAALALSADTRPLGLFVRGVGLLPRAPGQV